MKHMKCTWKLSYHSFSIVIRNIVNAYTFSSRSFFISASCSSVKSSSSFNSFNLAVATASWNIIGCEIVCLYSLSKAMKAVYLINKILLASFIYSWNSLRTTFWHFLNWKFTVFHADSALHARTTSRLKLFSHIAHFSFIFHSLQIKRLKMLYTVNYETFCGMTNFSRSFSRTSRIFWFSFWVVTFQTTVTAASRTQSFQGNCKGRITCQKNINSLFLLIRASFTKTGTCTEKVGCRNTCKIICYILCFILLNFGKCLLLFDKYFPTFSHKILKYPSETLKSGIE